jgi:hypothetical protein
MVSTAERMATFGVAIHRAWARSIAFCAISTLPFRVGKLLTAASVTKSGFGWVGTSMVKTWLMRRGADAGVLANDLGHQFICVETALHKRVSLAGTNELYGLLGCRMAVRLISDRQPSDVQVKGSGKWSDSSFGTHEDRLDDLRSRCTNRLGERVFIAWMCDGRPH